MARLASWRATNENDTPEALRWLDRSLIRLVWFISFESLIYCYSVRSLGNIRKTIHHPSVFMINLPYFLSLCSICADHNFYKSSIIVLMKLLIIGMSKCGKCIFFIIFRHILFSENVLESTTMIQPVLFSYSFQGPPEPVLLDTSSILPDRILLMDDYFHVLIYHGQVLLMHSVLALL